MNSIRSRLPKPLYRAAQVRELDRIAIEECGIEGFELMQRAASVAFSTLLDKWPQVKHVIVFVGKGNNGGDGYVVAGLAKDYGLNPEIVRLGDHSKLQGDALAAQQFADQRNVPCSSFDRECILGNGTYPKGHTVIVDALLGTGLDRPVSDAFTDAIATINELEFPVLAIDVPSGISTDTGNSLGCAVKAQVTTTFIGLKRGLLTSEGVDASGEIVYHNLDVPEEVFNSPHSPVADCHRIDMNQMSRLLLPRHASAHKGDFGHTVIIGGDYGYGGAALMAAEAAVRAGSGLVSLITRSINHSSMLSRRPEVMVLGTENGSESENQIDDLMRSATVVVVGPGLGKSTWSRQLFQSAMQLQLALDIPLVLDADALNLLAERANQNKNTRRDNWILTPHPGEAARLLECSSVEIQADRFAAVARLQQEWGGVCLLKGAGSLICYPVLDETLIELCSVGNPGMASGGMGDVLSGVIGGLVAQGFSLADSLRVASCVHGESADLASVKGGQRGMAATDLYPYIRQLLNPEA